MIFIKTEEEIELLRENNLLVSKTLAEVGRHIKPGVTTKQLDRIIEDFIRSHGATPAFLGYQACSKLAVFLRTSQKRHSVSPFTSFRSVAGSSRLSGTPTEMAVKHNEGK